MYGQNVSQVSHVTKWQKSATFSKREVGHCIFSSFDGKRIKCSILTENMTTENMYWPRKSVISLAEKRKRRAKFIVLDTLIEITLLKVIEA